MGARAGSRPYRTPIQPPGIPDGERSSIAPHRWLLPAIALGGMLAPLNSTMIAVALPEIRQAFDTSLTTVAFLVSSYLVVMAVGLPIGGRLGDLMGRRAVFIGGLVLFVVGSLACALALNLTMLVVGRLIQAAAGAVVVPNGTAMIRECIPEGVRGRAFGMVGMAFGVSAASGPPLGSLLIGGFGWAAMFWSSIPIALLAIVLGYRSLPSKRPATRGPVSLDLPGGILFAGALGGLIIIPSVYRSQGVIATLALLAFTTVTGSWFVRHEAAQSTPMVAIRLFRFSTFTCASTSVALSNLVMYTSLLSIPLYMDRVLQRDLRETGMVLAILSGLSALGGPIGGRWVDRSGKRRPAITGAAAILAGAVTLFLSVTLDLDWLIVAAMILMGAGLGLSGAPVQMAAVEAAPRAETGAAAGLFSTSRYIGSVVGSTVLAILISVEGAGGEPARFAMLFGGLTLIAAAGVFVNSRIEQRGRRVQPVLQPGTDPQPG